MPCKYCNGLIDNGLGKSLNARKYLCFGYLSAFQGFPSKCGKRCAYV